MDLSDLKIFRAVVEEGGITRAAEKLNRVQSNVTTRIQQLEEDLGVALFVRQGRKLHLAPAGQVLVGYADRLLSLAEAALDAVADTRPRGLFRLGAMESTSAVRLPTLFAEYHRLYPDVTLELRTGHSRGLATAVLDGSIDAALAAEPFADGPFEKVLAFREPLVIIAPADHPPVDLASPPPRTIITFEDGCPHRMRLETWFADRGEMPERVVEMASYHAILGCVAVGMGVSLLPRSVLRAFPDSHRLAVYELPPKLAVADTVLFWRKGGDAPKIEALAELVRRRDPDKLD